MKYFEIHPSSMTSVETREKSNISPDGKIVCSEKAQTIYNQPNLVSSAQNIASVHKTIEARYSPFFCPQSNTRLERRM
jgi:hypothetical protein